MHLPKPAIHMLCSNHSIAFRASHHTQKQKRKLTIRLNIQVAVHPPESRYYCLQTPPNVLYMNGGLLDEKTQPNLQRSCLLLRFPSFFSPPAAPKPVSPSPPRSSRSTPSARDRARPPLAEVVPTALRVVRRLVLSSPPLPPLCRRLRRVARTRWSAWLSSSASMVLAATAEEVDGPSKTLID